MNETESPIAICFLCNHGMTNQRVDKYTSINNDNQMIFIYKNLSICSHRVDGHDLKLFYSWIKITSPELESEWLVNAVLVTYNDLCVHMWCHDGSTVLKSAKAEGKFKLNIHTKEISNLKDWFVFDYDMFSLAKKMKTYSIFS